MRPRWFFVMLEACVEAERTRYRHFAELTRMHATTLVNIQLAKSEQIEPKELWKFEWDEESRTEEAQIENESENLERIIKLIKLVDGREEFED